MLASDVYRMSRARVNDLDWVTTLCGYILTRIHIRFARVNAYNDMTRYKPINTRVNTTRWNTTRQLSYKNRSCAYMTNIEHHKTMCLYTNYASNEEYGINERNVRNTRAGYINLRLHLARARSSNI